MISHQDSSSPLKIEDIKFLRVLQSDTNTVTVEAMLKSDLVTLKIEKPTWRCDFLAEFILNINSIFLVQEIFGRYSGEIREIFGRDSGDIREIFIRLVRG